MRSSALPKRLECVNPLFKATGQLSGIADGLMHGEYVTNDSESENLFLQFNEGRKKTQF